MLLCTAEIFLLHCFMLLGSANWRELSLLCVFVYRGLKGTEQGNCTIHDYWRPAVLSPLIKIRFLSVWAIPVAANRECLIKAFHITMFLHSVPDVVKGHERFLFFITKWMSYEQTLFWGNNYRLQSFIRLLAFRFNNILKSFKFRPLVLWAADPIFHPQCQFFCTDESKWQNQGLQNCWKSHQSQHLKRRRSLYAGLSKRKSGKKERATADGFWGGSSAVTQKGRWINTSTAAFEKHQRHWQ